MVRWSVGRRCMGTAGLVLVATALAACGGTTGGRSPAEAPNPLTGLRFGTMSGYVRVGPLRTIGASWLVPRVSAGSAGGLAATWIGAQAPGPAPHAPFIQVGVNENEGPAGPPVYVAFWSAQVLSFHPHALFAVTPGDRITATLRLAGGRWRVSIADTTAGRRSSFSTTDNITGRFNLAEWLQEDPTTPAGRPAPYPTVARVQFAGLTINGAAPSYATISSQWMSTGDRDFGPTPLRNDAFSIGRVTPTPAGVQYLRIVAPSDAAQTVFQSRTRHLSSESRSQIRAAVAPAAAAQTRFASALSRSHWPASATAVIHALVRQVGLLVAVLRAAPAAASAAPQHWAERYLSVVTSVSVSAHRLRRILHLPEYLTAATRRYG